MDATARRLARREAAKLARAEQEARLKAALKVNISRRKAQAKARDAEAWDAGAGEARAGDAGAGDDGETGDGAAADDGEEHNETG
ncbi:hypothetical protein [Frigidibacter sp. MR17.24]|uniref:hypothetical protein n=1 Tax=Frigidibacter sp. MR17.24 TaxID=3127345 RepID=UPI003012AEFF